MLPIFPRKNREMSYALWTAYHQTKLNSDGILDQTELFFDRTPQAKKKLETSPNKRIVQFGAGIGAFISTFTTKKQVVGYDYTAPSLNSLRVSGIMARNVDLNEAQNTSELVYQHLLTEDLSIPSDILMIRIFEYITPETAILFLFTLMKEAKPGTSFYIEIANTSDADEFDTLLSTSHVAHVPPNFIASFFSPRTDFKFIEHHLLPKISEGGVEMDIEQLVVQKL